MPDVVKMFVVTFAPLLFVAGAVWVIKLLIRHKNRL